VLCVVRYRSGLCDGPIPRRTSHIDCGVLLCDPETSRMRRPWSALGCCAKGNIGTGNDLETALNTVKRFKNATRNNRKLSEHKTLWHRTRPRATFPSHPHTLQLIKYKQQAHKSMLYALVSFGRWQCVYLQSVKTKITHSSADLT
jgi:hypothetical protein